MFHINMCRNAGDHGVEVQCLGCCNLLTSLSFELAWNYTSITQAVHGMLFTSPFFVRFWLVTDILCCLAPVLKCCYPLLIKLKMWKLIGRKFAICILCVRELLCWHAILLTSIFFSLLAGFFLDGKL